MTTDRTNSRDCRKRRAIMRPHGRTGDAGQALVELALVLPVLFLLLIGAAEFGRLAYAAIEVANAARAGVAYGAQNIIAAADIPNIKLAATRDAANFAAGTMTVTASSSCACSSAPSTLVACSTALTSCAATSRILNYVQVNTAATIDPLIHVPGLPSTYALNGQAMMRVAE